MGLDLVFVEALETAASERWGHREEQGAVAAELLDTVVRVLVMANSDPKKARPQPKPFHYPRPYADTAEARKLDRHKVRRALLGRG